MPAKSPLPPKSAPLAPPLRTAKKELPGQHSVIDRLQKLFPHSPRPTSTEAPAATRPGDALMLDTPPILPLLHSTPADPKSLKIRMLTWNMHDSLPKGDLEELFGKVPVYTRPVGSFPHLPNDENHSYHLVVVAGQECPTPSGIPMGLGASFKKEYSKSKDENERSSRHEDRQSIRLDDEFEAPTGWTSMVEDWLCNNGAATSRTASPLMSDVGPPKTLMRQKSVKDGRKGPYQLLIKERLMGIYTAIYIHRDLKPFVRGMSKSAVTAGLIGGRLGNKGGVGISLNIDGTTFLFLNAHLAAHEGKMHHRLANLAKIKAELQVDDFLSSDDPRRGAEDLTDKFDFTFLCGDLNFRLNISRLHADWLIARQEYAQALEFDQLGLLMKEGNLPGFHEGAINFPPTFKYDVLRPIKRRSRRLGSKRIAIGENFDHFLEVEERNNAELEDAEDDNEGGSIVSSAVTSINSRSGTEPGLEDDTDFYYSSSPGKNNDTASRASVAAIGVKKAKLKLLSLLSPSLSPANNSFLKPKRQSDFLAPPPSPFSPLRASSPSLIADRESAEGVKRRPPPMVLLSRSLDTQVTSAEEPPVERGVYDSSSKKRVPSWCDRVLWKTTITRRGPVAEEEVFPSIPEGTDSLRGRAKMNNFFSAPFRNQTPRTPLSSNTATPLTARPIALDEHQIVLGTNHNSTRQSHQPTILVDPKPLNATPSRYPNSLGRRTNTTSSPPATAPLPADRHPARRATDSVESPISSERPHSALWRFFPSFLSPTHTQGVSTPDTATPTPPPLPPRPVKGDVKCLTYNTLDDRQMRRLEGRSDHRPVIGTYIVYI